MSDAPDIRVLPVSPQLRPALLQLAVYPSQQDFVGRIADLLADAQACATCEPMVVLCNGAPIGFYRIETQPQCIAGRAFARPTLGLRAFFIDQHWQGRGLGSRALAALLADLVERHPAARDLALTVHVRNAAG